jgi:hypothetical protein
MNSPINSKTELRDENRTIGAWIGLQKIKD